MLIKTLLNKVERFKSFVYTSVCLMLINGKDALVIDIVWRSEPIHLDPFVFAAHLDQAQRNELRKIILSNTSELKQMCAQMNYTGIEAVSDRNYQNIYEIIRRKNYKK